MPMGMARPMPKATRRIILLRGEVGMLEPVGGWMMRVFQAV